MHQLQIIIKFQPADDCPVPIETLRSRRRHDFRRVMDDLERIIRETERTSGEILDYEWAVGRVSPRATTS